MKLFNKKITYIIITSIIFLPQHSVAGGNGFWGGFAGGFTGSVVGNAITAPRQTQVVEREVRTQPVYIERPVNKQRSSRSETPYQAEDVRQLKQDLRLATDKLQRLENLLEECKATINELRAENAQLKNK
jgi:hypothetical protein